MYCCNFLELSIADAGKKGIAVLALSTEYGRAFRLQFRACDMDDEDTLQNIPKDYDLPKLRLVVQTGLRYCPACGTNLQEIIKLHTPEFDALAVAHKRFVLG